MPRKSKEQERRERTAKRQAGWLKENTKKYTFTLSKNQDADMIEFMEAKDNKAGYLKDLVREDMKK